MKALNLWENYINNYEISQYLCTEMSLFFEEEIWKEN